MPVDPRTPVVIGVGQLSQRVDRGEPSLEPVDLLAEAARRAEADTGATSPTGVLAGLDSVRFVVTLSWRYRNPAALVAERVGAAPRQTAVTTAGGNSPQAVINRTAREIADGDTDLVLIGGAEAWRTRMAYRAEGGRPPWTVEDEEVAPAEVIGDELVMSHQAELARGIAMPVQMYPLFESAVRAAAGRLPADHVHHIAELWAGFSRVAATNPHAWVQQAYTADEIATPGPDNRMIGYPYPKLMNSNNHVEQAAAVIVASAERAESLGVPRDRWVFLHAGTDAHDHAFVSHRADLHSSPAIRLAGRSALELAGIAIDDVAHVDLYSCFPSAVQVAAAELGLGLDRPLTVTGGLSFAGGPWNDYVTHAVASMVGRLREHPGDWGLCSANGGFLTKHALGLYSTEPPANGFRWASVQAEVDALPAREVVEEHDGEVTVEAYTVMHSRDGEPENGLAAVLLPDGRRAWATTTEGSTLRTMLDEEVVGRAAHLAADGTLSL